MLASLTFFQKKKHIWRVFFGTAKTVGQSIFQPSRKGVRWLFHVTWHHDAHFCFIPTIKFQGEIFRGISTWSHRGKHAKFSSNKIQSILTKEKLMIKNVHCNEILIFFFFFRVFSQLTLRDKAHMPRKIRFYERYSLMKNRLI